MFLLLSEMLNSLIHQKDRRALLGTVLKLSLLCLRDCVGLSGSGSSYNADGCGDPHVHHHLLWLCGLPARKHLPPADSKSLSGCACVFSFSAYLGEVKRNSYVYTQTQI